MGGNRNYRKIFSNRGPKLQLYSPYSEGAFQNQVVKPPTKPVLIEGGVIHKMFTKEHPIKTAHFSAYSEGIIFGNWGFCSLSEIGERIISQNRRLEHPEISRFLVRIVKALFSGKTSFFSDSQGYTVGGAFSQMALNLHWIVKGVRFFGKL